MDSLKREVSDGEDGVGTKFKPFDRIEDSDLERE